MAAADSGDSGSSGGDGRKTVTLVSSDGARFEVREAAALLSQTVRRMIDGAGGAGSSAVIPLPDVNSRTLSMVIEYCNKHTPASAPAPNPHPAAESSSAEAAASEEDLKWFDREFVQVDKGTLFSLIMAAHHLKVQGLLDLTCQTVADMIKGQTTEEMRETLGLVNDFTPEEASLRREYAWDFVG
ncbi:unnamed protein product [Urochloa humidicola]